MALTGVGLLPLVRALTRGVEQVMGLPQERISDARQRIAMLLKEGAGHGVLSESQVTLVDRALMLRGVTVGDEMVPWSLVRSVPLDADRARALKAIGASQHTRVPVMGEVVRQSSVGRRAGDAGTAQGVVGMINQIQFYTRPKASVAELVRPVVKLSRTTRVREALLLLREHETGLGVVEDEQGRPVGIVTAKDLVEPLIGELADL
jgi:CBS domain containing-hemolysin-like protein